MKRKIVAATCLFLLMFPTFFAVSSIELKDNIIYVDDGNNEGPWRGTWEHPYQFIKDGIDNASTDDTVFVFNGTYYENIFIDKTISLIGEDRNTTIIDGGGENDVVCIQSGNDGVVLLGFTIQNSGNYTTDYTKDAGVDIHSDNNKISHNIIIHHPRYGIKLTHANKNIITNNIISHSGYPGYLIGSITLDFSNDNNISNNIITSNNNTGIELKLSNRNIISGNTISLNYIGISLWDNGAQCTDNVIIRNNIKDNREGISIRRSGNIISQNNFINNWNRHASSLPNFMSRDLRFITRNTWDANYWDDWKGLESSLFSMFPKYIPIGLNFDWHPVSESYDISGGEQN